jgi:long-chain acyl-CoA synthetase
MPQPLIKAIAAKMAPRILLATGQTEIYPATMSFDALATPGRDANYWGISGLVCETAVMNDAGDLLPAGEVGEIVHRGPNSHDPDRAPWIMEDTTGRAGQRR